LLHVRSPRFFNSSGEHIFFVRGYPPNIGRKESFRRILSARPHQPGSAKYYRRLTDEMKATVANYDINRNERTFLSLAREGRLDTSVSSSVYVAYKQFRDRGHGPEVCSGMALFTMKSFVLEETHMFLKIISEEIWDVESGLKPAIMIGNSEVGMGAFRSKPFIFRKPCTKRSDRLPGEKFPARAYSSHRV